MDGSAVKAGMYANIEPDPDHSLEELKAFRHATNAVLCRNGELNVNFRTGAFSISDGEISNQVMRES